MADWYDRYLLSPWWQRQRDRALARADHRCQVCNSEDRLQVHHRVYERLWRERPSDLIVLCVLCHEGFHFKIEPARRRHETLLVEETLGALECLADSAATDLGRGFAKHLRDAVMEEHEARGRLLEFDLHEISLQIDELDEEWFAQRRCGVWRDADPMGILRVVTALAHARSGRLAAAVAHVSDVMVDRDGARLLFSPGQEFLARAVAGDVAALGVDMGIRLRADVAPRLRLVSGCGS